MIEGQLRISILNIPEELTPLKLRGWLRHEAQDIQAGCKENDLVIIRVFIPISLKLRITQRELDKIFQAIVEKMPNIQRIEYIETKNQLSNEELEVQAQDAKDDLAEMVKHLEEIDSSDNSSTVH